MRSFPSFFTIYIISTILNETLIFLHEMNYNTDAPRKSFHKIVQKMLLFIEKFIFLI